jgi:DGQHR domain-containing protein
MYSFIVPVKDIIEFVRVLRFEAVPENKKAFQRIVDKDRLKIISDNYLWKNESFPSNIILTFDPEIYTEEQKRRVMNGKDDNKNIVDISLLKEFGSLIVIDGQHRILSHLKNSDRDLPKKILISILDFQDNTPDEAHRAMTEIFVQINNQHKKISPMVMLRIQALNEPDAPFSRWYKMFKELNKKDPSSYFSDMIEFEDTPLKRFQSDEKKRINISSLVRYAGVTGLEKGNSKYNGFLDEGFFSKEQLQGLIKDFFDAIKEVTKGSREEEKVLLSPRDIGGLIRLMVHFINDRRTKNNFMKLDTSEGKAGIKPYLESIKFKDLKNLPYGANAWAIMEGHFLGRIRKKYKGFGVNARLSQNGSKEMKKIMRN